MRPERAALITALLLLAGPLPAADRFRVPAPSRPGITITARPATTRPAVGSLLRVRVQVSGARHVGSVPFGLAYDPSVLEFVPEATSEGPFLRQKGASTTFLARAGTERDGRTAVLVGLSRLGGGQGARGSGVLCDVTFRVIAPGASPLSFVRAQALSPAAQPLPARFRGSSVQARRVR